MSTDPGHDEGQGAALGAAALRLDLAITALERKIEQRLASLQGSADLFASDTGHLAAELEASRARERALEAVAADASAALGRAAAEVRAALSAEEG